MCLMDAFVPGSYYAYKASDGKVILNLATQTFPGRYAKCEWIESALSKVLVDLPHLKTIALPTIGVGLGGLRWEDVEAVLKKINQGTDVTFTIYKFSM